MRYVGPFDLRGGQAVFRFDGGHIYIPFTQTYQPHFFCYHVNDHLGNVRVTKVGVGEGGSVLQRMNYYPFGGMMASSTGGAVQPYRYTGKELVRFQGLDWLDYGARWYDPAILHWNGVDKLAEKYTSVSPFSFCLNNPIRYVDLDGKYIYIYFTGKDGKTYTYRFNGNKDENIPNNSYVRDFISAYNFNIKWAQAKNHRDKLI